MTVTVRRVSTPPAAMRNRRLASLDEPQELFLERRVADGSTWLPEQDGGLVGYAVVDDQGTLLELFYEEF
jgi:hypothetical protein